MISYDLEMKSLWDEGTGPGCDTSTNPRGGCSGSTLGMVIGGIPGADIAVPVCFRSKPLLLFRIELLPNFFGDIIVGLQSGTLFDVPDEISGGGETIELLYEVAFRAVCNGNYHIHCHRASHACSVVAFCATTQLSL